MYDSTLGIGIAGMNEITLSTIQADPSYTIPVNTLSINDGVYLTPTVAAAKLSMPNPTPPLTFQNCSNMTIQGCEFE